MLKRLKRIIGKSISPIFFAVAGLVGAPGQSWASLYVGNFDPIFFNGTDLFNISDPCIPISGTGVTNLISPPAGCTAALVNAVVNVPANAPGLNNPFAITVVFGPQGGVSALDWLNGDLIGVAGSFIDGLGSSLSFLLGSPVVPPYTTPPLVNFTFCPDGPNTCFAQNFGGDPAVQVRETGVYARIPEPSSIGLLLAGTLAGWFVGRPRRWMN